MLSGAFSQVFVFVFVIEWECETNCGLVGWLQGLLMPRSRWEDWGRPQCEISGVNNVDLSLQHF